jgi:hypothetical protein
MAVQRTLQVPTVYSSSERTCVVLSSTMPSSTLYSTPHHPHATHTATPTAETATRKLHPQILTRPTRSPGRLVGCQCRAFAFSPLFIPYHRALGRFGLNDNGGVRCGSDSHRSLACEAARYAVSKLVAPANGSRIFCHLRAAGELLAEARGEGEGKIKVSRVRLSGVVY